MDTNREPRQPDAGTPADTYGIPHNASTSPWVRNAAAGRLPYKVHTDAPRSRESLADILRRTLPPTSPEVK